jgi:2-keto-4-pentenoate hydratase
MTPDIAQFAARQLRDYDARDPGTIFDEPIELDEAHAYAIQSEVCRLRQWRGESLVGYKVGCTSPGIQQQLGIDHPVFGRLFDTDSWPSGARLPSSRFSRLAIEGELAVRLARDVSEANSTEAEIASAIESVFAVVELHNFVFRRNNPSAEELIANNAIHAGFIYAASASSLLDSNSATLRIEIEGEVIADISGSELTHTIIDSLTWLARELGRHELSLRAGQTILCGSVADLIPISSGGRIAITTDRFGAVECTIE